MYTCYFVGLENYFQKGHNKMLGKLYKTDMKKRQKILTGNKWVSLYKTSSLPIRSSIWFMVCNFVQRGISMITTPIFARILTEEEYGIINAYTSWQVILEIIVTLCVTSGAMILFTKCERKEEALSALCSLEIVLGFMWGIVFFFFSDTISNFLGLSRLLCCCMLIQIIAGQAINLWMIYKKYLYEYRSSVFVTLINSVASSFVSVLVVLFISPTATGRLVSMAIVSVGIGTILYLDMLWKYRVFFKKEVWSFALTFSVPLIPSAMSQFVLSNSDKLMIDAMCGKREVAVYSIAYAVGSLLGFFTQAINASFMPYQYQQLKNQNYKRLAERGNQVLLLIGGIVIGIMLFGHEIILFMGGSKYLEGENLIVPVCIGVFFSYVLQLFSRVQEFYLYKLTLVISSTVCAALNLILNYIYISIYSYKAAAYTTFVCYFLHCILNYIFYKRVLKKELDGIEIYNMKIISLISLGVVGSGAIIMVVGHLLWLKYSIIGVACIFLIVYRKYVFRFLKDLFA